MPNEESPPVAAAEDLLRGIVVPEWWDPEQGVVSSAIFGFPKFSAYVASMKSSAALLEQLPDGSGVLKFNCGEARDLNFDALHEPEGGDESHANVYRTRKKKQARKLLQASGTEVVVKPDHQRLEESKAKGEG